MSPIAFKFPAVLGRSERERVDIAHVARAGGIGGRPLSAEAYNDGASSSKAQPGKAVAMPVARIRWLIERMVGREYRLQAERQRDGRRSNLEHPGVFEVNPREIGERLVVLHGPKYAGACPIISAEWPISGRPQRRPSTPNNEHAPIVQAGPRTHEAPQPTGTAEILANYLRTVGTSTRSDLWKRADSDVEAELHRFRSRK